MKVFKAGDLDKYKEIDSINYVYAIMYNWGQSDYIEREKRLLTESEQKEVNRQLIDDMEWNLIYKTAWGYGKKSRIFYRC
ncbi:hypothetical protein [Salipaludibacillus agaradhaerens]|jgi:hypothetical protein|uniref:hypothetical protein n=1 Tax=Salipaludibacillus agaradhaerens TaxID=76935 RepID=UPI002151BD06|nr:hypothetical protein [Salipaludibacillus agaradhaerens]